MRLYRRVSKSKKRKKTQTELEVSVCLKGESNEWDLTVKEGRRRELTVCVWRGNLHSWDRTYYSDRRIRYSIPFQESKLMSYFTFTVSQAESKMNDPTPLILFPFPDWIELGLFSLLLPRNVYSLWPELPTEPFPEGESIKSKSETGTFPWESSCFTSSQGISITE